MILGIDHIEIIVHDLDAHVAFYEQLGFVVRKRTTHHGGSVEVSLPGEHQITIELHQVGAEEVCGVNHIAFGVRDVANAKEELMVKGVRFEHNPPKYGGPVLATSTGRWLANFRSPDGGRLQLTSVDRVETSAAPDQDAWAPPAPGTTKT